MSGIPKVALRFDDLLKGLMGHRKTVKSQLRIMTASEYRLKSAKEKITQVESRKNQMQVSSCSLSEESHRQRLILPVTIGDNMRQSGKPT